MYLMVKYGHVWAYYDLQGARFHLKGTYLWSPRGSGALILSKWEKPGETRKVELDPNNVLSSVNIDCIPQ